MSQTINIDISTRGAPPVAYAHQGDTGRTFLVNLFENGEPFAVAGYTAKVAAIVPSGSGYSVIAGSNMISAAKTTTGDNQLSFGLTSIYTARSGRGILTIILTSNTGYSNTLRPINLELRIQRSADGDDIIAGASDFPASLATYAEDWFTENGAAALEEVVRNEIGIATVAETKTYLGL